MSNRDVGFLRTPAGIKVIGGKYSVHLTYDEIAQLNVFIASGARASSAKLQKNYERASLRAAPLAELQAELERRASLNDNDNDNDR
jgi:hypothetical protein